MKATINEVFTSVEGEAKYSGWPTTYIRFSKCNFKCSGFNNPDNTLTADGYAPLDFNPADFDSIYELSPMTVGCDSQYAVNKDFSHMWETLEIDELAEQVMKVVPNHQWRHPETGHPNILSVTGGEPMLQWKAIIQLLKHPDLKDLRILLIETNGSVPLSKTFKSYIQDWMEGPRKRTVVFSNSPKLSNSGESFNDAIKPDVIKSQDLCDKIFTNTTVQYLKFVAGTESDFDEIDAALKYYHANGVSKHIPVYIMPEACTEFQQTNIMADIADMCIQRGYIYCHRVHNTVYNNAIGK